MDIAGITIHPDEPWMKQIARNVTMEGCGILRDCRYLLHDRDTKYTQSFRAIIASGQVEPLRLVKANKIDQAIGRLKERYPRVARYFDLSYDPNTATFAAPFNADKYAKAERLDGCYLLKTDRTDLSGDQLWRIYTLLTRAENAFRDMKSPLAARPIFHHTERRTEAHIFLCVLARATASSSSSSKPSMRPIRPTRRST